MPELALVELLPAGPAEASVPDWLSPPEALTESCTRISLPMISAAISADSFVPILKNTFVHVLPSTISRNSGDMASRLATVCTAGIRNTLAERLFSNIRFHASFTYDPASSQNAMHGGHGFSSSGMA